MDDCCSAKAETLNVLAQGNQRRVLVIVMVVNVVMFAAEFGFGLLARSSAMMADSVDMPGDAIVYGPSLYALGQGDRWQAGAALAKGGLILAFGAGIVIGTAFKIAEGVRPSSSIMLVVTSVALAANLACLALLWRFRRLNVNMASTFECSRNDVIANIGVLVAAACRPAMPPLPAQRRARTWRAGTRLPFALSPSPPKARGPTLSRLHAGADALQSLHTKIAQQPTTPTVCLTGQRERFIWTPARRNLCACALRVS